MWPFAVVPARRFAETNWFFQSAGPADVLRSILCSLLVALFLTNKGGGDDDDPWEGGKVDDFLPLEYI